MSSRLKVALLAIVAVVFATMVVGCGQSVVAKVNGTKITKQEYYSRLEHLPVTGPGGRQVEAGATVLQRLIDEVLVLDLAEKEKVSPTDKQVSERLADMQKRPGFKAKLRQAGLTSDQFKEMLRVEQAAFNLQTKDIKVSDSEVKSFYDQNKQTQFTTPEHVFVAAIFAKSQADADKAMELLGKEVKFGTVARQLSADKASRERDGRLDRAIVRGDKSIPESIQNVVLNTPPGKYTKPISSGKGTSIIFQVVEHKPQKVQPFSDVAYTIRQQLMLQKGSGKNNSLDEDLSKFRDSAKISVMIERYKSTLLQEKSLEKSAK